MPHVRMVMSPAALRSRLLLSFALSPSRVMPGYNLSVGARAAADISL